jgi:N-acetyl-anhydromuramyl-L-alanine amidase AmpD
MNMEKQYTSKNFTPGRNGHTAVAIVMHVTGSGPTVGHLNTLLGNTDRRVSSHFLIAPEGLVYWLVALGDSAWANGVLDKGQSGYVNAPAWLRSAIARGINPNDLTISIEHVSADGTLTDDQLAASALLLRFLRDETGIPLDAEHVIPHNTITATDCPQHFPWGDLWTALQDEAPPRGHQEEEETDVIEKIFNPVHGPDGKPVLGRYVQFADSAFPTDILFTNPSGDETVNVTWELQRDGHAPEGGHTINGQLPLVLAPRAFYHFRMAQGDLSFHGNLWISCVNGKNEPRPLLCVKREQGKGTGNA